MFDIVFIYSNLLVVYLFYSAFRNGYNIDPNTNHLWDVLIAWIIVFFSLFIAALDPIFNENYSLKAIIIPSLGFLITNLDLWVYHKKKALMTLSKTATIMKLLLAVLLIIYLLSSTIN